VSGHRKLSTSRCFTLNKKRILIMKILITAICLCVVPAVAAPACATGTYASYQSLASGGCTIGDALFTNFSNLSIVENAGVTVLAPAEIEVIPTGSTTSALLTFVYLNAAGAPTPLTLNQNGQIFSMGFSFDILVSPSALTGIQMNSTFSNVGPGSVSASKSAQLLVGGPSVSSTVNDGGVSNPLGTYNGVIMPVTGTGRFLITDTTSLEAQTGSASQSGFGNVFILAPSGSTSTAENGSLAMIGSGLVFLSVLASTTRRRRNAKE
jgi:hypothetical protein